MKMQSGMLCVTIAAVIMRILQEVEGIQCDST